MSTLYDAFISYSHAKDKPLASALQSVMQRLGKPWYKRRALRLFRDDTSLAATPELWPSLIEVIDRSRHIILIASPEFARSKWCGMEVAHWLEHKSLDTMLIAVTAGDLVWDDAAGDFRWDAETPLPAALKGKFRTEPKWIDLRAHRETPDAEAAAFMEASADLAAAVHGIPKEDLLSQEVRQQRRALSLAWSAAAVLLALAGVAGWQWREAVEQQRIAQAQRDRAELALTAATETANTLIVDLASDFRTRTGMPLDLVRLIVDRARELQQQLLSTGEVAPSLLESAGMALDETVITLLDLGDTDGALRAAQAQLGIAQRLAAEDQTNQGRVRSLSVAQNKVGDVHRRAGRHAEAAAAYRLSLGLIAALSAAAPENAMFRRDHRVTLGRLGDVLLAGGEREEALALHRESLALSQAEADKAPEDHRLKQDLAVTHEKVGDVLVVTQAAEALKHYRESLALREAIAAANPDNAAMQLDLATAYDRVGDAQRDMWQTADALNAYRRSYAIRERLAASDPANLHVQHMLTISLERLGDMLLRAGRGEEALETFRRANAIIEKLLERDAASLPWQRARCLSGNDIGRALAALGRHEDAAGMFGRTRQVCATLVEAGAPDAQGPLANIIANQADTLLRLGRREEALAARREALALRETVAQADPEHGPRRRAYIVEANKLGAMLLGLGTAEGREEALGVYRRSLEATRRLAASDPGNVQWQRDLAFVYNELAGTYQAMERLDEALATLRESLGVSERLVTAMPENPVPRRGLSIVHERIGNVLMLQEKVDEAAAAYALSLSLRETLAAEAPEDAGAQFDLYLILSNAAHAEVTRKQREPALAHYRRAAGIIERLGAAQPRNAGYTQRLGDALRTIASMLVEDGRQQEAVALMNGWLDAAVERRRSEPQNTAWRRQEAIVLFLLAQVGDAPRERLSRALDIVRGLDAEGELHGDQKEWIASIESALAALPS